LEISQKQGKIMIWGASCPDTLAPSHQALTIREDGAVANNAKSKKHAKYFHLESTHAYGS
jgi:hypothetical protein